MQELNPSLSDPDEARFACRLRMLEELAEIGMEIARSLRPCAETPDAESAETRPARRDPAAAFAQVSRAVRLTLALEARTEADLHAWRCGSVTRREDQKAAARVRGEARKEQVHDLVMEVVFRESSDDEDFANLYEALDERLDWDEAYAGQLHRPLREIVARLCADLELTPDWDRWGETGWIDDGAPVRPRGSPFHQKSRKPLLDPDFGDLISQALRTPPDAAPQADTPQAATQPATPLPAAIPQPHNLE